MAKTFFHRLRDYYLDVAKVLRGEAAAASIFPNTTDIGMSRERIYAEFLRLHSPSKCNVFLGGFLFDEDGKESKQLDVIVTTDTAARFNFYNRDGSGKSFSPVEGTLGVASIKSMLDKEQLFDALHGIASIPPTRSLEGRISFTVEIQNYDDWPYKIIYATDGLKAETMLEHVNQFYNQNPQIPLHRRPQIIHVAGKYVIIRIITGIAMQKASGAVYNPPVGMFSALTVNPDLQGILWVLDGLQQRAAASTEIHFSYEQIINKVNNLPVS